MVCQQTCKSSHKNGLRLATDVWQYGFHTFITQMTTDNIVMWVARLSIVGWVYSKTQTFLATLRIQNQPRVESYASLEAEHLSPLVGCAKYKRQYPTHSSTESEIMSLDAGLRMDGPPALDLWDVVIEVLRSTNNTKRPIN